MSKMPGFGLAKHYLDYSVTPSCVLILKFA